MTASVHRTAPGLRWDPKAPWPPPLLSIKAHSSPKGLGQPRLTVGTEYSSEGRSPQGKEGEETRSAGRRRHHVNGRGGEGIGTRVSRANLAIMEPIGSAQPKVALPS